MMEELKSFLSDYLSAYTPYKTYWNYEDGCVLKGCIDLYRATGEAQYKDFVLSYLETFVMPDGSIPNYQADRYNIDSINCGKALYFGLDETGDARYRQAIEYHRQRLEEHPRCACGNFFHNSMYSPWQIWMDGLYMAQPFYMAYEMRYHKMENISDIARQFKNVRALLFDEEKGCRVPVEIEPVEQQPREIAKQIIRQTMWARKTLLKDRYSETDKPVRYSRSPIKLRAQYEHVYLTTPALLKTSLERIYGEEYHIEHTVKNSYRSHDPSQGDVEGYPNRYYLNPAFDLLKLVHFFAAVKGDKEYEDDPDIPVIRRILVIHQEDLEVAEMYPDVKAWKGARILAYRSP